jgi:hypothetical protein
MNIPRRRFLHLAAALPLLRGRFCEDHVGLQIDQLFSVHARPIDVGTCPTNVQPHIAAVGPAQLPKPLHELGQVGFCLRIVFVERRQHADPPHAIARAASGHATAPPRPLIDLTAQRHLLHKIGPVGPVAALKTVGRKY